jgi:hypothetical protein
MNGQTDRHEFSTRSYSLYIMHIKHLINNLAF